ncbi:hypothetical protein KAR91_12360 [Candidatus Pacearchaeota archaeon]|nr:hypothetical protein [Candidatus Pacearchaeota archaeon]
MSNSLYEAAKASINDVFNDKEATHEERLENLQGLGEEIEVLVSCVETDIENQ